jgi:TorA maturation chaperone TorD
MDDESVYRARLEVVDFLIEVFHDLLEESFVETLLSGEMELPDSGVNEHLDGGFNRLRTFIEANADRDPDAVRDELKGEYTAVFVGPRPPVLAHETYYRDDQDFLGKGLAEVEASYSAAGWNPPESYGEESDFVAVELAFLRHLIEAQYHGREEAFGFERVFLDEHLLQWVDAMADDVAAETDNDLYRAAGEVLRGFVTFEDELVAQMVSG